MKDDMISRRAAIDALHTEIIKRRLEKDTNDDGLLDEYDTEWVLRRLPSAQPDVSDTNVGKICEYYDLCRNGRDEKKLREELLSAQPVWIPLAVKYPETNEDVLLQFPSNQGVGFYENGSWGINTGDGIYSAIGDGEEMPMAWMPLPKPWEGR